MIKFRQKEFIAPVIAGAGRLLAGSLPEMAVSGAIGMAGNKMQQKANEEQAEIMEKQAREQKRQNEKMAEAMDKIAENTKNNPQAASQAANQVSQIMMSQKEFARINLGGALTRMRGSKRYKDIVGFGKDLGKYIGENKNTLIGGTLAGAAMPVASYITDKAIQADMKKSGIPLERTYSVGRSILSGLRKTGKAVGEAAWDSKGMILGTAVLGAAPTALGYMAEKQQLKDQIKNTTPREKTYSIRLKTGYLKGIRKKVGDWWRNLPIRNTPGETLLGGLSNMAGGGGREGVENFGKRLQELGEQSGSSISKKVGRFAIERPKTSLALSVIPGSIAMTGTWGLGEKLARKGIEAADNHAYDYQKSKGEYIDDSQKKTLH